jgi:pimeloyl-ACP methyl ester carboxylesterase
VDSPVRQPTPEQEAQFNRQAFGPLKLYPTREAALARFRVVPEQPATLQYVLDNLAENSVREVPDGWTWKFDPSFFGNLGQLEPEILSTVPCRVAILRAEFGLVTPDIGEHMYELLGRTAPVIEVPLAYHHIMLDQPIALVTAVRALLADWRHSYAHRRPV